MIGGLRPGKLVDIGVELLCFAAEIDGLAHEGARHADIGVIGADLVGFRARKAGDAVRVSQAEALVDVRVDPQFGASP